MLGFYGPFLPYGTHSVPPGPTQPVPFSYSFKTLLLLFKEELGWSKWLPLP